MGGENVVQDVLSQLAETATGHPPVEPKGSLLVPRKPGAEGPDVRTLAEVNADTRQGKPGAPELGGKIFLNPKPSPKP